MSASPLDDAGSPVSAGEDNTRLSALLARLAAEGGDAGLTYERLRARLILLFRLHLPSEAESLADEALERLARRVQEGVVVEHLAAYVHGIARLLLLEARSRPLARRASVEQLETLAAPEPDDDDDEENAQAQAALKACLDRLGAESASLILAYYGDSDDGRIAARAQLASRLGLKLNALRNRALRLRGALETCVRERLSRDGNASGATDQR